jgi:hypothetical protein
MFSHQILHITPGAVNPFRQCIIAPVYLIIEDRQPEVGQADLISVGESQRQAHCGFFPILDDLVELAARITAGF